MPNKTKAPVRESQADILKAYLAGDTIEYSHDSNADDSSVWEEVFPYQEPDDIYRLSNPDYSFRIKEQGLTTKTKGVEMQFDSIEEYQDSVFEFKYTNCEGTVNTMTFRADTWLEALENFLVFLKGAQFFVDPDSIFINGSKHPSVITSLEMYYPENDYVKNDFVPVCFEELDTSFNYGANHGGND